MMRAVHGSTVLYPCDANQTAKLVAAMADRDGIVYLRTTRAEDAGDLRRRRGVPDRRLAACCATDDDVAIVGAGITLHEALKAADALAGEGIAARVIDLYSVKPIDAETLRAAAEATGGRIVTVEDHWPEGGLGDAVLDGARGQRGSASRRAARGARDARLGQARRSCSQRPGSTPSTSSKRRARSSAPAP